MYSAEEWYMIREMREKGMSVSEIARQMHMSRNTVKKHMRLDKPLEYKRKRRKSKLDLVRPIIKELIDKYNLSSVRILEEIRKWGYQGSSTTPKLPKSTCACFPGAVSNLYTAFIDLSFLRVLQYSFKMV